MISDAKLAQLIDMGIEPALAATALEKHSSVADAAEAIFDGRVELTSEPAQAGPSNPSRVQQKMEIVVLEDDDDDDDASFEDASIGSTDGDAADEDWMAVSTSNAAQDEDPYKDINMSKDRIETIIDVEQMPRTYKVGEVSVEELTQSEWMKGCPEGNEQTLLFGMLQKWTNDAICPCCGHKSRRTDHRSLLAFWPSFRLFIRHIRWNVQRKCSKCSTQYCTACGELAEGDSRAGGKAETTTGADKGKTKSRSRESDITAIQDPLLHCSELQSLLLGVGLAHIERLHFDDERSGISAAAQAAMSDSSSKRKTELFDFTLGSGLHGNGSQSDAKRFKTASRAGTGFAGMATEAKGWADAVAAKQKENDKALADELSVLRTFLPSLHRQPHPVPSDYSPDTTALAHLRRRFLPIASKLLQSDSLIDMSERRVLYDELLKWFKVMSGNEVLAPLVAQPIMLVRSVKVTMRKDGLSREREITYGGHAGPRELLQSIVGQCETIIDRMKRPKPEQASGSASSNKEEDMTSKSSRRKKQSARIGQSLKRKEGADKLTPAPTDDDEDETAKLMAFCETIIETTKKIDVLLRRTKGDAMVDRLLGIIAPNSDAVLPGAGRGKDKKSESTEDRVRSYEEWARSQVYADFDLSSPSAEPAKTKAGSSSSMPKWRHAFHQEIDKVAADNSKRTMAIVKELASLRTSLPAHWHGSIFVRVDESRVDVLKAAVIGPEGSPYEGGIFLFDIFLPASYNSEPPKVKITTTNGGRHRFNPNLYADGKVCLSLLGTWSGPGWVQGRSTLLQVLLSIQSLIMGEEEPIVNEPGFSHLRGSKASTGYTKNLRRMTVATAMLLQLKSPPYPWEDVIQGHFRLKGDEIIKLTQKWLDEDDGKPLVGDGQSAMNSSSAAATASAVRPPSGYSFRNDVEELHKLIKKLKTA